MISGPWQHLSDEIKETTMKMKRIAAGLLLAFFAVPAIASDAPGEIVALQGKGDYREEKTPQWRVAQVKQKLAPASFVRTGELSSMGVLLADRTQIKLGQNSIFQIRAVAGQPPETNTQLDLKRGKAWSQTKNAGSGLFVKTPSALAGIHGTDWVIEVDDNGKTALTVFSGVIELSNEYGKISVGRNEHAEAEVGKAPVKRTLVNPKERVQWVTTHAFSPDRYRELKNSGGLTPPERAGIETSLGAVSRGDYTTAMAGFAATASAGQSPVPQLLAGDLALARGELAQAGALYAAGQQRFPRDGRFAAGLGRVALYSDDLPKARTLLEESRRDGNSAVLSALLAGDLARVEGRFDETEQRFDSVVATAPGLADGWFGRGSARLEVEDVKRSRSDLTRALELSREPGYALGELGTLESMANDLDAGRAYFARAIAANPGDYVALTGLGLLELKAGNTPQAFEHLLAANTIEPRYARSVLYLGVAYYLSGDVKAGLESLQRASELDEKDPLPHLMISLIHQDQRQPAEAIEAAQAAVIRMPYLKSLNQVANDQKGSASLGGAVAQFGLEDWARAQAHQAYYPYWGGSHLFLADRYQNQFNKNAELMQGFLADPTVFGADPKRQTLIMQPGDHAALSLKARDTGDSRQWQAGAAFNGYRNASIPIAYFAEGTFDRVDPQDSNLKGHVRNATFGLGLKPNHETGVFVFGNVFDPNFDDRTVLHEREKISGTTARLDAGFSYRFGPKSQLWVKAGISDDDIDTDKTTSVPGTLTAFDDRTIERRNHDVQIRHTTALGSVSELTYGMEYAKENYDDTIRHRFAASSKTGADTITEKDRSQLIYGSLRHYLNPALMLQGDLAWMQYRKKISDMFSIEEGNSGVFQDGFRYEQDKTSFLPRVGLAVDAGGGLIVRSAYQNWQRPISFNTLAPIATAGIALPTQYVLPGGEVERGRVQADWQLSPRTFVSAFVDALHVDNLVTRGAPPPENRRTELADLDRLRLTRPDNLGSLESLENGRSPIFTEGRIRSFGLVGNQLLTTQLTGYAGYQYIHSENRYEAFRDNDLPMMPKHKAILGATWTPDGQWQLQGQATWRSKRFRDEENIESLPAGWDMTLKAAWRSPKRNVWLEGWIENLLKEKAETIYTLSVTLRY